MAKSVISPEFRVSFPSLFTPTSFQGQQAKFKITMLFDKGVDLSALKSLAQEAAAAKWPDPAKRPANLRNPFRDGDVEKGDIDGYENVIFINASSKQAPGVVDQNRQPILAEATVYAGCYARALLTAYAYDTAGNRGVAFGLQHVQFIRDGDAFSGRGKAEDAFGVVEVEDMYDDGKKEESSPTGDMFA